MKNYTLLLLLSILLLACSKSDSSAIPLGNQKDTIKIVVATPIVPETGGNDTSKVVIPGVSRDKFTQPFASNSIWNMPVGSNATYINASLYTNNTGLWTSYDTEIIRIIPAKSPLVRLYAPLSWGNRCGGQNSPTGNAKDALAINIPANWVFPDATKTDTPNNCAAFIQPDGQNIISIAPLARCNSGGSVYGWYNGTQSIYGDGTRGSHGGSGLSAIGGSIRLGELTSADPIRHTLKINIWGQKYLYYRSTDTTPGYQWPANRADSYAASNYGGTNTSVEMGSLLAIPTSITAASLGLATEPAKKLFWTLQNYGAYVVDDTAWDVAAFCMAEGVPEEFKKKYSFSFETDNKETAWFKDYYKIIKALSVITNNSANTIGGGGVPIQPLALPIGN